MDLGRRGLCENKTRELKTACGHRMPALLHVRSGLARPADDSISDGTTGQTSGQREIGLVKT